MMAWDDDSTVRSKRTRASCCFDEEEDEKPAKRLAAGGSKKKGNATTSLGYVFTPILEERLLKVASKPGSTWKTVITSLPLDQNGRRPPARSTLKKYLQKFVEERLSDVHKILTTGTELKRLAEVTGVPVPSAEDDIFSVATDVPEMLSREEVAADFLIYDDALAASNAAFAALAATAPQTDLTPKAKSIKKMQAMISQLYSQLADAYAQLARRGTPPALHAAITPTTTSPLVIDDDD